MDDVVDMEEDNKIKDVINQQLIPCINYITTVTYDVTHSIWYKVYGHRKEKQRSFIKYILCSMLVTFIAIFCLLYTIFNKNN